MMESETLDCRTKIRRKHLFGNASWNGIDYVELTPGSGAPSLCVHFFGAVPETVLPENVRIEGGRRIRNLRVTAVTVERSHDVELDDCLRVTLDRTGDFSKYRVCLVEAEAPEAAAADGRDAPPRPLSGIDPRYACAEFIFHVDCPAELDCKHDAACLPGPKNGPEINYLAKDYASFRQLVLDRLAFTLPNWQERHAPDLGVTLVELLAYAGDHLSYFQDAVATEAYLGTARLRTSVRRHARLVDYRMHEGCNARAWVTIATATDLRPLKASDVYFITGFAGLESASGRVVSEHSLERVPAALYEVFEPLVEDPERELVFRAAHGEIRFYTWGDEECCLARGATRATLLDEATPSSDSKPLTHAGTELATNRPRALHLEPGDVLIFEEVLGPRTGNDADADPEHRHAVRLTRVTPATDELLGRLVLEIEWAPEDALPFALCLSTRLASPDCRRIGDVSLARGNVVLVDHGRRVGETLGPVGFREELEPCACDGSASETRRMPSRFRPALTLGRLAFGEPLAQKASAAELAAQKPHRALPLISLVEQTSSAPRWSARPDLLGSSAGDRHFVVEIDDEANSRLRFGEGGLGRTPEAESTFAATYRVGGGTAGNVGRDTIRFLVVRGQSLSADRIEPRNPLPARGAIAAEPTEEVKALAPHAFRSRRERAVTADDYAELAERNTKVQRAACELRWNGSWYEARVAVDPRHTQEADDALLRRLQAELFRYRRMGHDMTVVPARYVPLRIVMKVCALPHFARGHVRAAVLRALGNGVLSDGTLGFFHPDNLSFGEPIHASRLIARVARVEGVETAALRLLARMDAPEQALGATNATEDLVPIGPDEIARLDNDPSFPENGSLELILGGGR